MSQSPSYSPVTDMAENLHGNLMEDSDPIMNPFYYAQDRESWYNEVAAKSCEEHQQRKSEEKSLKMKKRKPNTFNNKSFVIRKEPERVSHLIKIIVLDVDGRNMEDIELDNASVNVQYLVTSDYDDIMTETDHLVCKIVKKLGKSNM